MESLEDVQARHKKEKKELQGKLMSLKKSVTKGDKKRKKEVDDEMVQLEKELTDRHDAEELAARAATISVTTAPDDPAEDNDDDYQQPAPSTNNKVSKAQKRREKRAEADKKLAAAASADEVQARSGANAMERQALVAKLTKMGLAIHEVASDGDCLYNSVAHQLMRRGHMSNCHDLRGLTADCIRQHADDFLPFLSDADGEPLDGEDALKEYCERVQGTHGPVWGGQPEIRALSMALERPIHVIQADTETIKTEASKNTDEPLIITYHRHAYGLGEHYNSTEPSSVQDEN